jgi:translation initiation factor IF-2
MANSGSSRPNRPIRPRQGAVGPHRKRRVVIDNQASRGGGGRPGAPGSRDARSSSEGRAPAKAAPAPTGPISVPSGVSVRDLSQALGIPVAQIIKIMMGMGEMVTITQSLNDEAVALIGAELTPPREITIKHASDEEGDDESDEEADAPEDLQPRPPVVTIMGHVDHGKTTLLDAVRKTAVAASEVGGITQHIGAYQVEHGDRRITFVDTPGHEAFTAMRARGANVTDIAVLVVAADDGVMPQTKESIAHARAADVPIVVAINKIDLPDANIDRVKGDLAGEGLQPEEWGGTTQFSEVSAKKNIGLDDLLEKVLLVADLELDLKSNPNAEASGPIIESRLDVGRGPVATMLVRRGTLRVGDALVAGDTWGKVRALYDYRGTRVKEARPGDPVEILGLEKPPAAGERCHVVANERQARSLAQQRGLRLRSEQVAQRSRRRVSLETLFSELKEGEVQDLNMILKGDVVGSVEAAVSELQKIQHSEVRVNVIQSGVGGITENDVMLASASNALIVGFNVRPSSEARAAADRQGVDIRTYRVIYQLTEDIEKALVGMLSAVSSEHILGEVEVRATFRASKVGTIAGCYVRSGLVRRGSLVRLLRDGSIVHETTISQLKRFKDDAREVAEGFECGILLEGYNDVKEDDIFEVYEIRETERTSLDETVPSKADAPSDK